MKLFRRRFTRHWLGLRRPYTGSRPKSALFSPKSADYPQSLPLAHQSNRHMEASISIYRLLMLFSITLRGKPWQHPSDYDDKQENNRTYASRIVNGSHDTERCFNNELDWSTNGFKQFIKQIKHASPLALLQVVWGCRLLADICFLWKYPIFL